MRKILAFIEGRWVFVLLAFAGVLFALNVLAFYPGYMSADSLTHLNEAKHIIPVSDLQPVIEPLVWRLLIAVTGHIASMLVFQLALLWSALAILAVFAYRTTGSKKLSLLPLAIGVLPVVVNISGVIWSDNLMAFSLLLASAIALFMPLVKGTKLKAVLLGCAMLLVVYACLSRYNAFFAIVPVLLLAIRKSGLIRSWRRQLLCVGAVLLAVIVFVPILKVISHAQHKSSVSGFMLDDVVHAASYASIQDAPMHPALKKTLVGIKTCETDKGVIIDSFWNCANKTDQNNILVYYTADLTSFWLHTVTHRPVNYALYKAEQFTLVLFPAPGKAYVWQWGIDTNDLGLQPKVKQLGAILQMYTLNFGYKHFSFLYEPWFWLVFDGALVGYALKKLVEYKWPVILLALSGLLYILGFIPTGVAVDYRYIYWPVLAGLMGLVLIVVERRDLTFRKSSRHPVRSVRHRARV